MTTQANNASCVLKMHRDNASCQRKGDIYICICMSVCMYTYMYICIYVVCAPKVCIFANAYHATLVAARVTSQAQLEPLQQAHAGNALRLLKARVQLPRFQTFRGWQTQLKNTLCCAACISWKRTAFLQKRRSWHRTEKHAQN